MPSRNPSISTPVSKNPVLSMAANSRLPRLAPPPRIACPRGPFVPPASTVSRGRRAAAAGPLGGGEESETGEGREGEECSRGFCGDGVASPDASRRSQAGREGGGGHGVWLRASGTRPPTGARRKATGERLVGWAAR